MRFSITDVRENTIAYDSVFLVGLTIITVTGFVSDWIRNDVFIDYGISYTAAPPAAFFHVIVSLLFCIAYIPYSKYMHMIAAPLVLLANKGGE